MRHSMLFQEKSLTSGTLLKSPLLQYHLAPNQYHKNQSAGLYHIVVCMWQNVVLVSYISKYLIGCKMLWFNQRLWRMLYKCTSSLGSWLQRNNIACRCIRHFKLDNSTVSALYHTFGCGLLENKNTEPASSLEYNYIPCRIWIHFRHPAIGHSFNSRPDRLSTCCWYLEQNRLWLDPTSFLETRSFTGRHKLNFYCLPTLRYITGRIPELDLEFDPHCCEMVEFLQPRATLIATEIVENRQTFSMRDSYSGPIHSSTMHPHLHWY